MSDDGGLFYDGAWRPLRQALPVMRHDLERHARHLVSGFITNAGVYDSVFEGIQVRCVGGETWAPLTHAVDVRLLAERRLRLETRVAGLGFVVDDVWAALRRSFPPPASQRDGDSLVLSLAQLSPERERLVREAMCADARRRAESVARATATLLAPVFAAGALSDAELEELSTFARDLVENVRRDLDQALQQRLAEL